VKKRLYPPFCLCNFSLTISRAHNDRDIPWPQRREDQRDIIPYFVAIDAIISHLDLSEEMLPYIRQHLPILRRLAPIPDLTFTLESRVLQVAMYRGTCMQVGGSGPFPGVQQGDRGVCSQDPEGVKKWSYEARTR
jgi:hypothetical protein